MTEADPTLVTLTHPRSPAAEAYRTLRTNVQFAGGDQAVRTMLITSAGPDEGKSAAAANLAITLAQADHSVVLADCDLRRPVQHQLFGLQSQPGLTDMLGGDGLREAPLQDTSVPKLSLLASGPLPPNPAELLGSVRMGQALGTIRELADYIVIDSPPVVLVTDAALLATQVDGVLLVLSLGKVKREVARKAKTLLENVQARILGVVLNNAPYDARDFQDYYAASS
ncbi:MAG: capsular biosynthesis protein [Dehalococcoidia bacterium]|nr:capsular biosynthesis protein [Dehalococcoidia bacterium]